MGRRVIVKRHKGLPEAAPGFYLVLLHLFDNCNSFLVGLCASRIIKGGRWVLEYSEYPWVCMYHLAPSVLCIAIGELVHYISTLSFDRNALKRKNFV